jgi:hypothetical protein
MLARTAPSASNYERDTVEVKYMPDKEPEIAARRAFRPANSH